MQGSQTNKLILFGSLYISQGLSQGFFQVAAPVVFRERGVSVSDIGILTALFSLPWIFKFLIAPLTDRFYSNRLGRRRTWLIPLQITTAIAIAGISFWTETSPLWVLFGATLIINLASATQDTATDGYAVELLEQNERGWGNGVQTGSYWIGMLLGGGLMLTLIPKIGWQTALLLMTVMMLAALSPVVFRKEPAHHIVREQIGLKVFFKRKNILRVIAIVVIARITFGFQGLIKPMLVDFGFDLGDIGILIGIIGPIAGLIGAALAGLMSNPLGRRRSLILFTAIQFLGFAAMAYIAHLTSPTFNQVAAALMVANFTMAMMSTAVFATMMDHCNEEQAAGEYTLFDCMTVFAMIIFSIVGYVLADMVGYTFAYALAAVTVLISATLVAILFTKDIKPIH